MDSCVLHLQLHIDLQNLLRFQKPHFHPEYCCKTILYHEAESHLPKNIEDSFLYRKQPFDEDFHHNASLEPYQK